MASRLLSRPINYAHYNIICLRLQVILDERFVNKDITS